MVEVLIVIQDIVLRPEPATARLGIVELDGWMIEMAVTSLPIVLKPKPATVRLVMIELDGSG
ncbi:hypothetical protein N7453_007663 [Penicillium expansum]|nr:hypothetical protein N7453_007663 [Penicillium expansum]